MKVQLVSLIPGGMESGRSVAVVVHVGVTREWERMISAGSWSCANQAVQVPRNFGLPKSSNFRANGRSSGDMKNTRNVRVCRQDKGSLGKKKERLQQQRERDWTKARLNCREDILCPQCTTGHCIVQFFPSRRFFFRPARDFSCRGEGVRAKS